MSTSADVIVVLFSNVGVEAALMDLPMVIAKLDMETMPLPLDEFGIGATATNPDELRAMVTSMLYDEAFRNEIAAGRRRYIEANPFLAGRNSTRAIADTVIEMMNDPKDAVAGQPVEVSAGPAS